jgi:hypothetical protein
MARLHSLTEGIALRFLARDGIAAIWHLQVLYTELATRFQRPPFWRLLKPQSANISEAKPCH